MKIAKLYHNPNAGDTQHDKEELVKQIEDAGFNCRYSSTKSSGWSKLEDDTDLVVIAGGDGTVRKITRELLDRKIFDKQFPLALLPLGTANNISRTLGVTGTTSDIIRSWKKGMTRNFDVGKVSGLEPGTFFLESIGFGLIPKLMKAMKKADADVPDDPDEKIIMAQKMLRDLACSYHPRKCKLSVNGKDYSGRYLLAEIMNIRSIGPNLVLSRDGEPDDGQLEMVLIPENARSRFVTYLEEMIKGGQPEFETEIIRGNEIQIRFDEGSLHTDDEVIKMKQDTLLSVEVVPGMLQFMIDG